jgi:hypothetical protein
MWNIADGYNRARNGKPTAKMTGIGNVGTLVSKAAVADDLREQTALLHDIAAAASVRSLASPKNFSGRRVRGADTSDEHERQQRRALTRTRFDNELVSRRVPISYRPTLDLEISSLRLATSP